MGGGLMVWEIVDIPGSSSPSSPRTSWDGL